MNDKAVNSLARNQNPYPTPKKKNSGSPKSERGVATTTVPFTKAKRASGTKERDLSGLTRAVFDVGSSHYRWPYPPSNSGCHGTQKMLSEGTILF